METEDILMRLEPVGSGSPPLSWTVGRVQVTALVETNLIADVSVMFPNATEAGLRDIDWLRPDFVDEDWRLKITIQALLVRTPDLLIIVDPCFGNDKTGLNIGNLLHTDFLDRLQAAGFSPDDVDVVLCTHLHVDHVGWNTKLQDGRWVPTFPKARYLFGRTEYAHWQKSDRSNDAAILRQSVDPIVEAGLAELIEADHWICDEIRLLPTPGHSPGHVSVAIASAGREALITGDMAHHPAQITRPDWCSLVDSDPAQAVQTRHAMFEKLADGDTLVIGTHFHRPTAGWIVRTPDGYRLDTSRPGPDSPGSR